MEERNSRFSTSYLFNAKELDNETGLYYYGARYLDPTGAMWLSVDPLFEKYAGMSPYNYCMGNPVKMVDLDGEFGVSIHESITRDALAQVGQNLSKRQKRKLVAGSRQADILGFSKPYHFDSDKSNDFAFSRSANRYGKIAERWNKIYSDIENLASKGDFNEEGRMLHNTQDFYAHSNYIELYVKYYVETKGNMIGFDIDKIPTFDEADGDFKNLLKNELKTGEWYGFIKSEKSGLYKKSKLGDDSHYRVNKDCRIRKKSLKGGLIIDGTGNITYFDAARKVALKHTMKLLRKYHGEE